MKRNNGICFYQIILWLAYIVVGILSVWLFKSVLNSDLPDWIKYILLR